MLDLYKRSVQGHSQSAKAISDNHGQAGQCQLKGHGAAGAKRRLACLEGRIFLGIAFDYLNGHAPLRRAFTHQFSHMGHGGNNKFQVRYRLLQAVNSLAEYIQKTGDFACAAARKYRKQHVVMNIPMACAKCLSIGLLDPVLNQWMANECATQTLTREIGWLEREQRQKM